MPASYDGAVAAIRARFDAGWTTTRKTFQNEQPAAPWPPVDGDGILLPWVYLEIIGTGSEIYGQGTPGNHTWHYAGLIYAHVFAPVGAGGALAQQYAAEIGEIFRAAKFYDDVTPGCYVRTWSPRTDGGGSGDDDGNWFRISAVIDFEYWHRG
jgi:hypothetical protein